MRAMLRRAEDGEEVTARLVPRGGPLADRRGTARLGPSGGPLTVRRETARLGPELKGGVRKPYTFGVFDLVESRLRYVVGGGRIGVI